jgi:predicted XRE-type DNA-binding protein/predicted RNase H-like HicB family nuclease
VKFMKKNKDYFIGSGNVFADLGLPNPEELLAKAELALQINRLIKQKKLTQIEAAKILGIDQSKIAALSKGKLSDFSLQRLSNFLSILKQIVPVKATKSSSEIMYHFEVHKEKNGFWAEYLELPGCFTQARTMKELHKNMHEALDLILEESAYC